MVRPKLPPVGLVIPRLAWGFAVAAGRCSGYFKVSGIGAPMRSRARLPQPNDLYREPDEWLAPAHFRTRTKPDCLNDSGQIK